MKLLRKLLCWWGWHEKKIINIDIDEKFDVLFNCLASIHAPHTAYAIRDYVEAKFGNSYKCKFCGKRL